MCRTRERPPLTEEQRSLAAQYVPLAKRVSLKFGNLYPRHREEFRSVALLALTEAAQSFRPEFNVKFTTFAFYRMLGEFKTLLRSSRLKGYRYQDCKQPEILSLDHGDESVCPAVMDPEPSSDDDLEWMLRRVPRKHANICRLHYRNGLTMREVGRMVGLSESGCSRIRTESLAMLRHELGPTINS